METLMLVLKWIGYVFAAVGFVGAVAKSIQVWMRLHVVTWKDLDRYSKKIIRHATREGYVPDVIVGIGRGGAVLGAVLSGNLPNPDPESGKRKVNIPLLCIDRIYRWEQGRRYERKNDMVDLSGLAGKRVLLVAGDVMTGETMAYHLSQLQEISVGDVKTTCLVKGVAAIFNPTYVGKEVPADFRMPWMYPGSGYARDPRATADTTA